MKKDEMGLISRARGMHEKCVHSCSRETERERSLAVNVRIILK
jgi:hypothetical protein